LTQASLFKQFFKKKEVKTMKKLLTLVAILGLGILLVAGCQTSSSETTTIPESTIAGSVAMANFRAFGVDASIDLAAGGIGVAGALSASDVIASAITFTRVDGWFTGSDNFTIGGLTQDRTINFKAWDGTGIEVMTVPDLANLADTSKLQTYTTITYTFSGGSYDISFGASKSDPLTFTYSPTKTIDGPIQYTSTYSGDSFQVTFDYGNLTLNASGLPVSGSVSWAVFSNSTEIASGTITFNGTNTAILTFTRGGSGTYNIDLSTGQPL
jgi:hypothetical protein